MNRRIIALLMCLILLAGVVPTAFADNIDKPALTNVSAKVTKVEQGTMEAEGFGTLKGTIVTFKTTFNKAEWTDSHFVAALRANAPGSNYAYDKMGSGTMPFVIVKDGEKPRFEEGVKGPNGEKITQNGDTITVEKKVCYNDETSPDTPEQKYGAYNAGEKIVVEVSAYKIADNGDAWNAEAVYVELTGVEAPRTTSKVTFKANGGKGTMAVIEVTNGEEFTLPKNQFTRSKNLFIAWNTKKKGTGETYRDGAKVTVNKDTTFYAQWGKVSLDMTQIASIKKGKKLTLKATAKVDGKPVKGLKVTFTFKGEKYTVKTDENGVAKKTIKASVTKVLKTGAKVTVKVSLAGVTIKQSVKVKK